MCRRVATDGVKQETLNYKLCLKIFCNMKNRWLESSVCECNICNEGVWKKFLLCYISCLTITANRAYSLLVLKHILTVYFCHCSKWVTRSYISCHVQMGPHATAPAHTRLLSIKTSILDSARCRSIVWLRTCHLQLSLERVLHHQCFHAADDNDNPFQGSQSTQETEQNIQG